MRVMLVCLSRLEVMGSSREKRRESTTLSYAQTTVWKFLVAVVEGESIFFALVHECIFIDMAEISGGIREDGWRR